MKQWAKTLPTSTVISTISLTRSSMTRIPKCKFCRTRSKAKHFWSGNYLRRLIGTTGLHIDQKTLQQKNAELVEMYREKSKKQAQTQHLYDTLKKRVMTSQVQTAASDSVTQVINSLPSVPRRQPLGSDPYIQPPQTTNFHPNDQRSNDQYQQAIHSRSPTHSSRHARVETTATAMPPPPGPPAGDHSRRSHVSLLSISIDSSR
jgi:hypothetical protein